MRKLLFILNLLLIVPCLAQNYKPLLDNFNEWHLTYCYHGCLTDVYYTDGDTIVDGKNYKILDGYHFISRTLLLREELDSRKVYLNLVARTGNTEYLLYDFSLNIGDSIDIKNPISPFPTDGGFYKVDSIVSQELADGNEYRHFYLSPTPTNTISNTTAEWIEGIGSLSLINAPGGYPDINSVGHLSCFFKNGELFYSNTHSSSGCEPVILSNDIGSSSLEKITLNTLIKDGQCQMHNTENIRFIDVFDLNGRKLTKIKTNGQEQLTLDFSNFSTGMYLIVAHSEKFQKKVFKVLVK